MPLKLLQTETPFNCFVINVAKNYILVVPETCCPSAPLSNLSQTWQWLCNALSGRAFDCTVPLTHFSQIGSDDIVINVFNVITTRVFFCFLQKSFESVKGWFTDLRRNSCAISVIALVGSKCDLDDRRRIDTFGELY